MGLQRRSAKLAKLAVIKRLPPSKDVIKHQKKPQNGGLFGDNKLGVGLHRKEWWARQDSNLRPDRYERPALTS